MQNRGRRVGLLALLVLVGTGVAMAAASAGEAGDHRLRLIRSWPENVTFEGRSAAGRVEVWFDYTAGVAIHKTVVNAKGPGGVDRVLKSETFPPGVGLARPSTEEIAEAMDLVRADKEIARIIASTSADLDGGFQIFESADKACGPGTRCLEIQLMTQDRLGLIRNVVVDLTKQEIVYRTYVPADGKGGK
jgi:hypothetical protein